LFIATPAGRFRYDKQDARFGLASCVNADIGAAAANGSSVPRCRHSDVAQRHQPSLVGIALRLRRDLVANSTVLGTCKIQIHNLRMFIAKRPEVGSEPYLDHDAQFQICVCSRGHDKLTGPWTPIRHGKGRPLLPSTTLFSEEVTGERDAQSSAALQ